MARVVELDVIHTDIILGVNNNSVQLQHMLLFLDVLAQWVGFIHPGAEQ